MRWLWWLVGSVTLMVRAGMVCAQGVDVREDHEAIGYRMQPVSDAVAKWNGEPLRFEGRAGYLRAVLQALKVPIESQIAVFSKTSLQAPIISPANPRTIYFSDSVYVAWVPGEPFVEVAAVDPRQGVIFYVLDQNPYAPPKFRRANDCLTCHNAAATLGVPGVFARSVYPAPSGYSVRTLGFFDTDHSSKIEERWGGWFVTGNAGGAHLGNAVYTDLGGAAVGTEIEPKLDTGTYLSPHSDVAALMVFEHQLRMTNLLVRFGWQIRIAASEGQTFDEDTASREIVDYMLFRDEAPLAKPVQGSSGFTEAFAAGGIRDAKGRSLRDLDLKRRLMRYPCSYMIYSPVFDGLPDEGRSAIYRGLLKALKGTETLEVLRGTKRGLPEWFARDSK
jgi:hypothetical protein